MTKVRVGTVSIQGQIGSFSHQAVDNIFQPDDILERPSFIETFQDLIEERADAIVVPIENSTYGSIYENYDHLSLHRCRIVSETYVRVKLNLIGLPGAKLGNLKKVYSHQVALDQIKIFRNENKQIQFIPHSDTAGAVEFVKDKNDVTQAACASDWAAKIYNLETIVEEIEDNYRNFTRFLQLLETIQLAPTLN